MGGPNTGFDGDNFEGSGLFGLYAGIVVNRDDPEKLSRVKVEIPGIIDGESAWALPEGGGAAQWGKNAVPPLGCDVFVQFVNGRENRPVYRAAAHGKPGGTSEAFPEHEAPDVSVFGIGPFRLVIDNREIEGQPKTARAKIVRDVNGTEEDVAWVEFNYDDNSIHIYADSAIGLEAAIIDLNSPQVQLNGRQVMPTSRPVN